MTTKKKTAAAAVDNQKESAAAAAPMTPAAALTGSGVARPETTPPEHAAPTKREPAAEGSGEAKVRVRFLKRCESAELRCVFRPGAQAIMPIGKAEKYAAAGFVSVLCPVI